MKDPKTIHYILMIALSLGVIGGQAFILFWFFRKLRDFSRHRGEDSPEPVATD